MVISWIAYHNAVNKNPPPSEQLQIAAVSNSLDALTQLALYSKHGGWSISPAVQAAAKNKHNQSEDFQEILDILGDAIDPSVKSYINKKFRSAKR